MLIGISSVSYAENRALIRDNTGRTVGQLGSQGRNLNVYDNKGSLKSRFDVGKDVRETYRASPSNTQGRPSQESRPTYSAKKTEPSRAVGKNFGFKTPSRLNK